MAAGLTFPYELANGNTADADEVMANLNQIKNNLDPDTIEDASANITEMQATTDPYPGASESLADALRGELKRMRYQLDAIIGKTNWYQDPDTNLLLEFNKGADIASVAALALGTDGNYFDVTGTTGITSINTRRIGSVVKLHFDGALVLTHHATNLVLPSGLNITTAAGDEIEFYEYDTGKWRCTNYSGSSTVRTKVIEIGDWNMDANSSVAVAHGLAASNIRGISVLLIADGSASYADFPMYSSAGTSPEYISIGTTNVTLFRSDAGIFDNVNWDATSFNRGFITITYL